MTVVPPLRLIQLFYDGVWNDITSYVALGQGDSITITRGRQDEGSSVDTSQLTLKLNNKDGRFSPRNPMSPLYGKIGRNTPLMVQVKPASAVDYSTRFTGEVSAWPQSWNDTGDDVWTQVTASGIMRRLGQGESVTLQAYKDFIRASNPAKYFPLDDPSGSLYGQADGVTSGGSASAFQQTALKAGSVYTFGDGDLGNGLPNVLSITGTGDATGGQYPPRYMYGHVGLGAWSDEVCLDFVYKADNLGVLELVSHDNGRFYGLPADNRWRCQLNADGVNDNIQLILDATDAVGAQTSTVYGTSANLLPALTDGQLHHIRLDLATFTDTSFDVYVDGVDVLSGTAAGKVMYGCRQVEITYIPGGSAVAVGHIAVWPVGLQPQPADVIGNLTGFAGEAAGRRILRVALDQGLTLDNVGNLDDTALLGPQASGGFLEILRDAEGTDLGILYEPRDVVGLAYRTRTSLYNQAPAVTLDYANGEVGTAPAPTDDDLDIHNDITVSNYTGTQVEASLDEGALSTQAPPDGINVYATNASVNCVTDALLPDQAGWRLHMGTIDEARYPSLAINLLNPAIYNTAQIAGVLALDIGDRAVLTNMPAWLGPGDVSLMVQGQTETISKDGWDIVYNCTPESPYQVAVYGTDRYDSLNSVLSGSVDATQTTLTVGVVNWFGVIDNTRGLLWTTDPAAFPFDINVDGERMTVTNIVGANSPQTFTVVRSVNGVTKSHIGSAKVALWKTPRYAL